MPLVMLKSWKRGFLLREMKLIISVEKAARTCGSWEIRLSVTKSPCENVQLMGRSISMSSDTLRTSKISIWFSRRICLTSASTRTETIRGRKFKKADELWGKVTEPSPRNLNMPGVAELVLDVQRVVDEELLQVYQCTRRNELEFN